ncbi:hypothetical protein PC119_g798 [Phytophthora cactorum]|uniref:Uncharacterized protein n=1 Tax=Phytophthora cactorum TaxID=29920 RepID=A0A8T1EI25_9STRA|nr:hypothetical protein PC114_g3043 [Phytophthora cactorum]KAG2954393.1 hypothetical protein PC117_g1283 [Phytophthora cactorum]KAG3035193.1 hypothetical protein PC120_g934 [Phytophthora cactorum]KAG3041369.1 hypothetical protein PC119_g798 [Phytophthora cactorum]KAG3189126.1 hypothetical protein C6341_g2405 [Phytophthora cactorum]
MLRRSLLKIAGRVSSHETTQDIQSEDENTPPNTQRDDTSYTWITNVKLTAVERDSSTDTATRRAARGSLIARGDEAGDARRTYGHCRVSTTAHSKPTQSDNVVTNPARDTASVPSSPPSESAAT